MTIHLCISHGFFLATMATLSSWNKNHMIHGLKHLLSDALQKTAPDLEGAVLTPFLKVLSYKTFFYIIVKFWHCILPVSSYFRDTLDIQESSISTPTFYFCKRQSRIFILNKNNVVRYASFSNTDIGLDHLLKNTRDCSEENTKT